MRQQERKFELCKSVFNMLFVAWLGSIGYIFINFETLNKTKIIIGVVGVSLIAIFLLVLAKIFLSKES